MGYPPVYWGIPEEGGSRPGKALTCCLWVSQYTDLTPNAAKAEVERNAAALRAFIV